MAKGITRRGRAGGAPAGSDGKAASSRANVCLAIVRNLVVAHGGGYSMSLGHLLAGGYDEWQPVMDNCAVTELVVEPRPEILSFNLTDHLECL